MSRVLRLLLCMTAAGALFPAGVRAQMAKVPEPTLRAVSDFAGLLDGAAQARIEGKLRAFRDSSGNQIVFISVPVAWRGEETIENYSLKIAEKWQIGRKKEDNGVIFLIVGTPQDTAGRGVRFEVGYGLEGTLPDALCKRIQLETVVPRLQAGDYPGAVDQGVDALITVLGGGRLALPAARPRPVKRLKDWFNIFWGAFFICFLIYHFYHWARNGFTTVGGSGCQAAASGAAVAAADFPAAGDRLAAEAARSAAAAPPAAGKCGG